MRFRATIAHIALCTVLALVAGIPLAAQAHLARTGDDLTGLWGVEPMLGPQVRGEVLLERVATRWTLRVGGFETSADITGDSVVIALPGGQGVMRLWPGAPAPDAFWVQPAGINAPYAIPVRLHPAGVNLWRGVITPIEAQFPLYMTIRRVDDGALHAIFRNPAQNWPGRVPYYVVSRDGASLSFTNPRTNAVQWRQPYDSARRTIAFDFDAPIVLTPRTTEQAVGFVPRSPSLPPYRYRRPADLADGWDVDDAQAAGVGPHALETIVRDLVNVDALNDTAPRVHSLLVARRGRLVLEEYFHGYGHDIPHDLRSASKTMTSIMVGAAMLRGAKVSGATTLPGTRISVAHLLSHSSGVACNDDDDASPGNEDTMQSQRVQDDWYAFFLALPKVREPGTTYAYCSAGVNITGQLLGRATNRWLPRLFDAQLARPMQFASYGINLMPTGEAYSGGGMHVRPRDLLKFGQLYLNGGVWRGQRLVSAAWVRESIAHRIDRADGSADGLGWHRHVLVAGGRRYQTYEASGNGGQFLVVVPALQLTIVVTAGNYGQYDVWRKIREQLVPAVVRAAR